MEDRGVYSQRALYTCMRIAYVAQHSKNKKKNIIYVITITTLLQSTEIKKPTNN